MVSGDQNQLLTAIDVTNEVFYHQTNQASSNNWPPGCAGLALQPKLPTFVDNFTFAGTFQYLFAKGTFGVSFGGLFLGIHDANESSAISNILLKPNVIVSDEGSNYIGDLVWGAWNNATGQTVTITNVQILGNISIATRSSKMQSYLVGQTNNFSVLIENLVIAEGYMPTAANASGGSISI